MCVFVNLFLFLHSFHLMPWWIPLFRNQCRTVKITILGDEGVPIQVDGEAWIQPPGVIKIQHKNRAQMLTRDRVRRRDCSTCCLASNRSNIEITFRGVVFRTARLLFLRRPLRARWSRGRTSSSTTSRPWGRTSTRSSPSTWPQRRRPPSCRRVHVLRRSSSPGEHVWLVQSLNLVILFTWKKQWHTNN